MKLTKADLVQTVRLRLDLSRKQAEQVLNVMVGAITSALAGGEPVRLADFGKFALKQRPAGIYRPPGGSAPIRQGARNAVRFTAFARLNERVAAIEMDELEQLTLNEVADERRQSPRNALADIGSAIVRLSGIPICEFKIKDISENGSAVWVEEDSVMLRNIRVGQEIDIRINTRGPAMQRARIIHISEADRADRKGYWVLGVQILGQV